jgi:hypothetical protein
VSQTSRILAALRNGPVSPISFAAPNVIDGGPPIMRVAARIKDLRDAGHLIRQHTATDNRTAIYTLTREVEFGDATAGEPPIASGASSNVVVELDPPVDWRSLGQRQSAPMTQGTPEAPPPLFDDSEFRPTDRFKDAA